MDSLTKTADGSLGIGLAIALVLAIYGAAGGVGNLITAINAMFGLAETRGFIKRKLLALVLTLGAIVFVVLVVGARRRRAGGARRGRHRAGRTRGVRGRPLDPAARRRHGRDRRAVPPRAQPLRRAPLISKGVLVATALWLLVSVGFSLYVDNFGSYGKTYGALAGVVVLLLWLWIGIYAILLGACVEAVREEVVTAETVEEDTEIAEWRTAEADGRDRPAEVVEEPERRSHAYRNGRKRHVRQR